ncbi:MAG: hypothetical protein R3A47_02620 [Polyangiales bacterium]
MCGIVGSVGEENVADVLISGLQRLEYRGYDSAGVAIQTGNGIEIRRAVGKLRNLEKELAAHPIAGTVGIGHTRWATHGRPTEVNAHPHLAGPIALVHNGIIENHLQLRETLESQGYKIVSDTDTEILAHLVHREFEQSRSLFDAVQRALRIVRGAYAIAVLCNDEPDRIVVAQNASPLVIGLGEDAMYCASDIPALLPYTNRMIFLKTKSCRDRSEWAQDLHAER